MIEEGSEATVRIGDVFVCRIGDWITNVVQFYEVAAVHDPQSVSVRELRQLHDQEVAFGVPGIVRPEIGVYIAAPIRCAVAMRDGKARLIIPDGTFASPARTNRWDGMPVEYRFN